MVVSRIAHLTLSRVVTERAWMCLRFNVVALMYQLETAVSAVCIPYCSRGHILYLNGKIVQIYRAARVHQYQMSIELKCQLTAACI